MKFCLSFKSKIFWNSRSHKGLTIGKKRILLLTGFATPLLYFTILGCNRAAEVPQERLRYRAFGHSKFRFPKVHLRASAVWFAILFATLIYSGCSGSKDTESDLPSSPALLPLLKYVNYGAMIHEPCSDPPCNPISPSQIAAQGATFKPTWVFVPTFCDQVSPYTCRTADAVSAMRAVTAETGISDLRIHFMSNADGDPLGPPSHANMTVWGDQVKQLTQALWSELGIRYFSISNEVRPTGWTGTLDQYRDLISAAYTAIKQVNTDLIVLDSGMSGGNSTIVTAKWIFDTEGAQPAVDFWNDAFYYHHMYVTYPATLANIATLTDNASVDAYSLARFQTSGSGYWNYYDVLQLHYYASAKTLLKVLDYVEAHMPTPKKPIQFWEFGYMHTLHIQNNTGSSETYNTVKHADAILMMMANTAFRSSTQKVEAVAYSEYFDKGLLARGIADRKTAALIEPPATAWRQGTSLLKDFSSAATSVSIAANGDHVLYRFPKQSKPQDVYIVWKGQTASSSSVDLGVSEYNQAVCTFADGTTQTCNPKSISILDGRPRIVTDFCNNCR